MALELDNKTLAKKSEGEVLDLLSGADDCMLVKAGETFTGTIMYFIVHTKGTITALKAKDTLETELITGVTEGMKNIAGVDLEVGTIITPGKYKKGANFKSVTTGTATIFVYYKYTISRA